MESFREETRCVVAERVLNGTMKRVGSRRCANHCTYDNAGVVFCVTWTSLLSRGCESMIRGGQIATFRNYLSKAFPLLSPWPNVYVMI